MSFQFSPETFLAEIDFQLEKPKLELEALQVRLSELLEIGPPPKVEIQFESCTPTAFIRCNPGVLNAREVQTSQEIINAFNRNITSIKETIQNLKNEISVLLDRKRLIQTEIQVRKDNSPTDINLDLPAPILTRELQPQIIIQKEQLPLKELALIAGAVIILG